MENNRVKKIPIQKFEEIVTFLKKTKKEISKIIVGQHDVKNLILISILSNGHSIITGVPGLAKTMLIRNLSTLFDVKFSRIQFTPDLMPSDIIGAELIEFKEKEKQFKFHKGPIFANLILADEINRTPPKTQSALLQAMEEKNVTIAGKNYNLPIPFFVFATQNPIEQEGTYPLPEAELDRFLFNIEMDYPTSDDEFNITKNYPKIEDIKLSPLVNGKTLISYIKFIDNIEISNTMIKKIVKLIQSTRPDKSKLDFVKEYILWGAGPRASQYLMQAAKANALLKGHTVVADEDVNELLLPVLKHRIILNFSAQAKGIKKEEIIDRIKKRIEAVNS